MMTFPVDMGKELAVLTITLQMMEAHAVDTPAGRNTQASKPFQGLQHKTTLLSQSYRHESGQKWFDTINICYIDQI